MPTKPGGRVQPGGTQKSTPNQIPWPQPQLAPHSKSKPTHHNPETQQITRPRQNRLENSRGNRNTMATTNTSKHEATAGRAHPRSTPRPMRGGWQEGLVELNRLGRLTLVRSGPAPARRAANPAGRVPGRRGRRDLGRSAGEIGLGLARGGGGRRGGAGGGGGGGERKETGFKQWD